MTDASKERAAQIDELRRGMEAAVRDHVKAGTPHEHLLAAMLNAALSLSIDFEGIGHTIEWLRAHLIALESGIAKARRTMAN